ncbi:hypothetical protein ASD52_02075 [Ensifer sp. Root142]|uniref:hypothetical protein n=1 Tax=Ensifer sp. Root142 TaxID=1736461 RepID=UPI0007097595|nr:hypothetical protein [Ensifer sp. Root142]KQY78656.1 hypothetical protein ASD52_02075 [Ensifer sp. Root142]
MNVLSYPLGYLRLTDEHGRKLFRRNALTVVLLTALISAPFIFAEANFFGDKGFLDRIGSFSAVLTGFYIAALVGVASFSSSIGDLDEVIVVGPIKRIATDGRSEDLTRRQYVCSLFGYLSFVSLIISIGSILLIVAAAADGKLISRVSEIPVAGPYVVSSLEMLHAALIIVCSLIIAHLFVTTCHGLYYLIDRLYQKNDQLLEKPDP